MSIISIARKLKLILRPYRKYFFIIYVLFCTVITIMIISYKIKKQQDVIVSNYGKNNKEVEEDVLQCHFEREDRAPSLDDDLMRPTFNSIFFHETSCKNQSFVDENGGVLTARQACSVESAVRQNPDRFVYLIFSSPLLWQMHGKDLFLEILKKYDNLRVVRINIEDYVKQTPIFELIQNRKLMKSSFPVEHASDLLRLVTLYKYGGVYLDLDIISVKPIDGLGDDWIAFEERKSGRISLGNSAMALTLKAKTGRVLADAFLKEAGKVFNGKEWSSSCFMEAVVVKVCGHNFNYCKGLHRHGRNAFFSIEYTDWWKFFESSSLKDVMYLKSENYGFHMWNKYSAKTKSQKDTITPYQYLANTYCPHIYHLGKDQF